MSQDADTVGGPLEDSAYRQTLGLLEGDFFADLETGFGLILAEAHIGSARRPTACTWDSTTGSGGPRRFPSRGGRPSKPPISRSRPRLPSAMAEEEMVALVQSGPSG